MTKTAPEIPIDPTPLERLYDELSATGDDGERGQRHHLQIADRTSGGGLATMLAESVAHLAGYENPQPFYKKRVPLTGCDVDDGLETKVVASWLERHGPKLTDAAGVPIGLSYVDRELVPLRTAGQGRETSERSKRGKRLDLLLRAADGAPVVGELKVKNDQHPFYALVQALVHVAQLASDQQRDRVATTYPDADFDRRGPLEIALIFADNWHRFVKPSEGWRGNEPKYTPQLTRRAIEMSEALVHDESSQKLLGRITWLSSTVTDGRLTFRRELVFPNG